MSARTLSDVSTKARSPADRAALCPFLYMISREFGIPIRNYFPMISLLLMRRILLLMLY